MLWEMLVVKYRHCKLVSLFVYKITKKLIECLIRLLLTNQIAEDVAKLFPYKRAIVLYMLMYVTCSGSCICTRVCFYVLNLGSSSRMCIPYECRYHDEGLN